MLFIWGHKMIKLQNYPIEFDAKDLIVKLQNAGCEIQWFYNIIHVDANNNLCIDIDEQYESIVQSVLSEYNYTNSQELKEQEKQNLLDRLGITEEEAKLLLS